MTPRRLPDNAVGGQVLVRPTRNSFSAAHLVPGLRHLTVLSARHAYWRKYGGRRGIGCRAGAGLNPGPYMFFYSLTAALWRLLWYVRLSIFVFTGERDACCYRWDYY